MLNDGMLILLFVVVDEEDRFQEIDDDDVDDDLDDIPTGVEFPNAITTPIATTGTVVNTSVVALPTTSAPLLDSTANVVALPTNDNNTTIIDVNNLPDIIPTGLTTSSTLVVGEPLQNDYNTTTTATTTTTSSSSTSLITAGIQAAAMVASSGQQQTGAPTLIDALSTPTLLVTPISAERMVVSRKHRKVAELEQQRLFERIAMIERRQRRLQAKLANDPLPAGVKHYCCCL
jgi:hypothetical protein